VQAGARADEGGARHGGQGQGFQRADRKQQKGLHLDKPGAVCYSRLGWQCMAACIEAGAGPTCE
jgi:hypothetical protein